MTSSTTQSSAAPKKKLGKYLGAFETADSNPTLLESDRLT